MSRSSIDAIADGVLARRVRDIARAITLVENGGADAQAVMSALADRSPGGDGSRTVGLTGAPGVGKSTMTAALIAAYREQGLRVGVLAVDPSSPFSGGALLGDRIRMQSHSGDHDVYIRSMASRGHLGGLAAAAGQVLRVFDAAGFDRVLIETVGVGQSEVEIAAAADTTVVLVAPGMGDGIQAAKAGILEIGDVFVVNKADRDGASATARELRAMLDLAAKGEGESWRPPVLSAIASTGSGVAEVVSAIDEHFAWSATNGELKARRQQRAREEILTMVLGMVRTAAVTGVAARDLDALAADVASGHVDVHRAAEQMAAHLLR